MNFQNNSIKFSLLSNLWACIVLFKINLKAKLKYRIVSGTLLLLCVTTILSLLLIGIMKFQERYAPSGFESDNTQINYNSAGMRLLSSIDLEMFSKEGEEEGKTLNGVRIHINNSGSVNIESILQENGAIIIDEIQEKYDVSLNFLKVSDDEYIYQIQSPSPVYAYFIKNKISNTLNSHLIQNQIDKNNTLLPKKIKDDVEYKTIKHLEFETLLSNILFSRLFLYMIGILLSIHIMEAAIIIQHNRAAGTLEPLSLVPRPFWVFYLPHILDSAFIVMIITVCIVFIFYFFGIAVLSIKGIFLISAFSFSLCLLCGMWGSLQTLFFHHKHSRIISSILLSPISMLFLLFLYFQIFLVSKMKGENVNASKNILVFIENIPIMWALFFIIITLSVCFLLGFCIEKRLGPRRIGLSRV